MVVMLASKHNLCSFTGVERPPCCHGPNLRPLPVHIGGAAKPPGLLIEEIAAAATENILHDSFELKVSSGDFGRDNDSQRMETRPEWAMHAFSSPIIVYSLKFPISGICLQLELLGSE
jgi:hypothetical protein